MINIQLYTVFELSEPFIHDWKWLEDDIREYLVDTDDKVDFLKANQINNHLYLSAIFETPWEGDFASLLRGYLNDLAQELQADIIYRNIRTDEVTKR